MSLLYTCCSGGYHLNRLSKTALTKLNAHQTCYMPIPLKLFYKVTLHTVYKITLHTVYKVTLHIVYKVFYKSNAQSLGSIRSDYNNHTYNITPQISGLIAT